MDRQQGGAADQRISTWAGIVAGALLLCWPAALNGFPLVFADTGNYLGQALEHFVGWNAPPFYSFFLLATDLHLSLWLPVVVQALLAAHVIAVVLRQFGWRGGRPTLIACLLLAGASSLPWFASLLTTDIFTGLLVLALWLLAFGQLGRWERRWFTVFAIGCTAVHLSHVPLAAGLAIVAAVAAAILSGRRAGVVAFARLAVAPAAAVGLLVLVNLVAHGIPAPSPYGSVLVAARFIGDGTARTYLRRTCPTRHWRICPYLDRLGAGGNDFLWDDPVLPEHLGGGERWAPEASAIVAGTIRTEPRAVLAAALRNTLHQFGHLWLGAPLQPWPAAPGPEPVIARFFPGELPAYQASAQNRGRLEAEAGVLAPVELAADWAGMAALVLLVAFDRRDRPGWTLCLLVLAGVLGNALITASLSGVEDRYESRIAWLLPFAPALVLGARGWLRRGTMAPVTVAGPAAAAPPPPP